MLAQVGASVKGGNAVRGWSPILAAPVASSIVLAPRPRFFLHSGDEDAITITRTRTTDEDDWGHLPPLNAVVPHWPPVRAIVARTTHTLFVSFISLGMACQPLGMRS